MYTFEGIFIFVVMWIVEGNTNVQNNQNNTVDLKFSIASSRNTTGHWSSMIQFEHIDDENNKNGLWEMDIERSTSRCDDDSDFIIITASIKAPPVRRMKRKIVPPNYEMIPGLGYYRFHSELKTWLEARDACVKEGGHLTIINSQEEATALLHFWLPYPKLFDDWRNDWAHIGFHDQYSEGNYVTIFNDPLSSTGYVKWYPGQPNAADYENCGVAERTASLLGDVGCGVKLPFFCELEF